MILILHACQRRACNLHSSTDAPCIFCRRAPLPPCVLPHWEYDIITSRKAAAYKIAADIAMGLFVVFFALRRFGPAEQALILWGAFFSIVPDGFSAIYFFSHGKYLRRQMQFHIFWHALIIPMKTHPPLWFAVTTEIIVIAASLFLLLR